MTSPSIGTSSNATPAVRRLTRGVLAIGLCLVAVAVWIVVGRLDGGSGTLAGTAATAAAVAVAGGLAAYGAQRSLRNLVRRTPRRFYRSAFAVSIVAGTVTLAAVGGWSGIRFLALILGSFLGGLAATSADFGLWEDNFPPPPEVVAFVREAHRARLPDAEGMPWAKRLLDLAAAAGGLILTSPLAALVWLLLWLEDPGPLFFVKNSVGKHGRNFRQWKLRTMVRGAEAESGPVWAEKEDQRLLRIGSVLRRTALDELPQLANILAGQMSLVGPRPQRTVLVADYLRRLPAYADRHRLPPGLAGLAQVAGHYYLTPLQKLRFDRLYLEHAGLGFDLKLIAVAFAVVFWLRWRQGWNGRLPRSWLHRHARR